MRRWTRAASGPVRQTLALQWATSLAWIGVAFAFAAAVSRITQGASPVLPALVGAGFFLLRIALSWWSEVASARAGRAMVGAARAELLAALSRTGAGFLDGAGEGERTAQLLDRTARLAGHAARWKPGSMVAVIVPVCILIAVATQSWLSAVLLLAAVLVLPVFIWMTATGTASVARAQQDALETLAGAFQARTAQAGLIRAFRAVGRESAILRQASEELRRRTLKILGMAFLSSAVLEFFASISIALVAVYVGFKLLGVFPFATGETLTLSEGMTVLVLAPEFFAPIRKLSSLHHDRADAKAAAGVLSAWLDEAELRAVTRLPRQRCAPAIVFAQASLVTPAGEPLVTGLDFTAQPGAITVLAGPSGSGKTSALRALLGQVRLSAGAILIDGRALEPAESLADSIAWVRQSPWVMEGSLESNLRLARPDASDAQLGEAVRAAGLSAFAGQHCRGLQRPLARFGEGLSGGERQRLALARALLRDAPILLLDEPTAHLDAAAEAHFLQTLRTLVPGRTVILATHRPAVISAADQVIHLPEHDPVRFDHRAGLAAVGERAS